MNTFADHADLGRRFREFAAAAPQTLRREKLTADLAPDLERALAIAEAPFTLAVVGPMRVGKSTLINALAGADLALPGVTETTATVNWFRHGTPEQAGRFRAVWTDVAGTSEEFALAERERWSGNSELAARTRYLEFFSPAAFLKAVHVVDTPGTRSTLTAHEEAARGFLLGDGRAERDTLYYGGAADCIVYVLPPVGRDTDRDLLGEFAGRRRLPQSTPANSVGVLHKWEALEHAAPWEAAVEQARRAFAALRTGVCDVIPVSGPLARAAADRPPSFWDEVLRLVRGCPGPALEAITLQEQRFTRPRPDCPLPPERRQQLLADAALPWPCFKTLLAFAAARPAADGEQLRRGVEEVSGLARLRSFLESRFFARARAIRTANVLNHAVRTTDVARGRLRNRLAELRETRELGREAVAAIGPAGPPTARTYLERTLYGVRQEEQSLIETLDRLEAQTRDIREGFQPFEADCRVAQCLDEHGSQFEPDEAVEIFAHLGLYARRDDPADALHAALDRWLVKCHAARSERRIVLEQVVRRLEDALRTATRPPGAGGGGHDDGD